MTGLGRHAGRLVVVLVATGLLTGCVAVAGLDESPESAATSDATRDPALTSDATLDLVYKQFEFDPTEYEPGELREGVPIATLSEDGVLSIRQVGSLYCDVEPMSFQRREGGTTLRVTYEFMKPNPDALCLTVPEYFATDVSLDRADAAALRAVIIVGPFDTATEVTIDRV